MGQFANFLQPCRFFITHDGYVRRYVPWQKYREREIFKPYNKVLVLQQKVFLFLSKRNAQIPQMVKHSVRVSLSIASCLATVHPPSSAFCLTPSNHQRDEKETKEEVKKRSIFMPCHILPGSSEAGPYFQEHLQCLGFTLHLQSPMDKSSWVYVT